MHRGTASVTTKISKKGSAETTFFHFAPLSTTLIPILYHAWVDCKEIMKNFFRALFLCPPKKPFRQYSPTIDTVTTISPHPLYFVNPDAIFHKRQTKKEPGRFFYKTLQGSSLLIQIYFQIYCCQFGCRLSSLLLCLRGRPHFSHAQTYHSIRTYGCHEQNDRQHLGYGNRRVGDKKGVRADAFDPRPAQAVTAQIQQPHLSPEFLVLPVEQHKEQQRQVPQTFI